MMEYFAVLDVSIGETAICVLGDDREVVLETKVPIDPQLIAELHQRHACERFCNHHIEPAARRIGEQLLNARPQNCAPPEMAASA